jgi:ribosomal protein S18 acetylase RimI-like enzyme
MVSASGVTFQLLGAREAAEREDELLALHADVYGDGDAGYARRLRVWRRQPGFALAAAWHGEYLVGYACGMPLRPSTSWWKELTAPLPEDVTAEHPGRTFALTELAVRASWRRQGIASSLHGLLLAGRTEERTTLAVPPDAAAAQLMLRNRGWRKIARTRGAGPQVLDLLVLPLALLFFVCCTVAAFDCSQA